MTVQEIRATVQDLIGPHNGLRSLSAPVLDELVLKAAYAVFRNVTSWRTRGETTINIVASTASYDLPSNFLKMETVVMKDGASNDYVQVRPIIFDEKHLYTDGSDQQGYYITAGSTAGLQAVVIVPTPSTSVTSGMMVRYRKKPSKLSALTATDEYNEIDEVLHLPLCHEAAYLYLSRQGSKASKDFMGYREYFQMELANHTRHEDENFQRDFINTIDFRFGGLE